MSLANNVLTTPFQRTMNDFAQRKIAEEIQQQGKAFPCSIVSVTGGIVTVKFELANTTNTYPNVTCPIANSLYVQEPTQVGDKGYVVPADAYMGGISGLGGGTADTTPRGNLATLVFHPVANSSWSGSPVPGTALVQGPAGVVLQTIDGNTSITITESGIAIKGNVTVNGFVMASGEVSTELRGTIHLSTHEHPTAAVGGPSPPSPGT